MSQRQMATAVILPTRMSLLSLYPREINNLGNEEWGITEIGTLNISVKRNISGKVPREPRKQWCECREILSRRRGFVCMTGAKPCPHCGFRVPARIHREVRTHWNI